MNETGDRDPAPSNRDFYDRISRAYDLIADAGEHKARQAGERALRLQTGERVLEIGCGTGNSLIELARCVGPEGRVAGIDSSTGMIAVAEEKLSREGLAEAVELHVGDARALPFDDGSFDAVFMSFTLELFSDGDTTQVLDEVRRVLVEGGRLGVVCMAQGPEEERGSLLERAYRWMHRHFPHIVDCRPIDVDATLRRAGFEIVTHEALSIFTIPVAAAVGVKSRSR